MKKILISTTHFPKICSKAKRLLEDRGYQLFINGTDKPFYPEDELMRIMHEIDGVIAGLDTWDERIFRIAPNLRVVAKFGVGVDNIDLEKAKEHGIKVLNAKGRNTNAVAELTIAFMLNLLREIPHLNQATKNGRWERVFTREIAGKTVGLVGFGAIGQNVAHKLSVLNANVLAYDKFPNYEIARKLNVRMVSFEDLLIESDIVTLHLPSVKETFHIMSRRQFDMMKDSAYFINTSRGSLVDEKALYDALKTNKLSGAAIDVYENEPTSKSNPLFELGHIICTPHLAALTYEACEAVGMSAAIGVIDALEGRIPENWINP